jgi:hypothetical protein
MCDKGALANSAWTNKWEDLQFFSTIRLCVQQEIEDKLCFHLAAKHAVAQQ